MRWHTSRQLNITRSRRNAESLEIKPIAPRLHEHRADVAQKKKYGVPNALKHADSRS
jgi:hypothetical protein